MLVRDRERRYFYPRIDKEKTFFQGRQRTRRSSEVMQGPVQVSLKSKLPGIERVGVDI